MRSWLAWPFRIIATLAMLAILTSGAAFLWLRSSLPQVEGTLVLHGLLAEVVVTRDGRGVPVIEAASREDAYFALGFVHAQDRLFQMDGMRRLGAGRLAEVIGEAGIGSDRLMRTLGLYRSAEAQVLAASPALKAALGAYAAGVNAYLDSHRGAWPPEFYLLGYRPEPWRPADSLVWGRLMALDLSSNWQSEASASAMQRGLPPYLFELLVKMPPPRAATGDAGTIPPWRQPLDEASNSWATGAMRSAGGQAMIANDPHLGLVLPATWYLACIKTPEMTWTGATAPGMPFIIIGTNGHVAWTFTTTHGDTQDLFEERLVAGGPADPVRYETPAGPLPFTTRRETIKVKDAPVVEFAVRNTRHGPVVSDLGGGELPAAPVLALGWAALLPGDRTPEAIMSINDAHNAAALEVALVDFHAPQQNIVYADQDGVIGFVAAGRVPVRRRLFADSRLPAPGWSGEFDWLGTLPMSELPQFHGDGTELIVTANNDIRRAGYQPFLAADWPNGARAERIDHLLRAAGTLDLEQFRAIQMDAHSGPLVTFVRRWLKVATQTDAGLAGILASWDGTMDRNQPAPLVATIWVDRAARLLLEDEMRGHFDDWWFWQIDRLQGAIDDGRACDNQSSPQQESCDEIIATALRAARADLSAAYGADPAKWRWGDSHRAHFSHPVFSHIPLLAGWLDADLATDGDFYTVNRGTTQPPRSGVALPHIHGASLRFLFDFAAPGRPLFALAGGQSGNPLSRHYGNWLNDWRDGVARPIAPPAPAAGKGPEPAEKPDRLILRPAPDR